MRWFSAFVCLFITAIGPVALAADTGAISGTVFDTQGQPVPRATVSIAGEGLPLGRTASTGTNGQFQFEYLLPGEYVVEIDAAALGRTRRTAFVEVGRHTEVEVIVGLAVIETLTVTAVRPVVDVRSTEVSSNFDADTLHSFPLERTYRGMFQVIPGIADNRSSIGPAAGGSRQDNTYLVDGANLTSPAFGYLSTEVNELDLAEVNLKRAGITAEFGRTAGTVMNAISRSGTNRLSALGRFDAMPEAFVGEYALPDELLKAGVRPGTFRDALLTTERAPAIGVGGPIWMNHVFFYGSARVFRQTKWNRFNKVSEPLPDEVRSGWEYFGKITANPTMGQQLAVTSRQRPNQIDNAALTSDFAPSAALTSDNGSRIATAEWSMFMRAQRAFNVRYLYLKEDNHDVPVTDLGYLPVFNPNNLAAMGQYTDQSRANLTIGGYQFSNTQNYRRHEVRGTFTQYADIGRTTHVLKAGAGYELGEETFNRLANGWGAIVNITQNNVPALRTRYFTPQAPQIGRGATASLFVQDEMAFRRASVNAGLLLSRDRFSQYLAGSNGCPANVPLRGGAAVHESRGDTCTFLGFGFADEIQPRAGVSYQLRRGDGDKAYMNWGRYYSMDQKSSARSLAPNRIFQTQTVFDLNGVVLSSGPLASTTGKMIDPDLEPIYTDEVVLGYATPFAQRYSADVFFMSRRMNNFIEDVPSRMNGSAPDSGPFVAANLPCVRFASCQLADARRTYRALTVDVRRRLANGWSSDVSYTWSRFEGNFDLDYALVTVFNTSSFIQDAPGTNVEDSNRFGPLFEDRPHVFKLFGSYAIGRLLTSGYLRVQSGTPWAARGRDWAGAVLNFLEPAGSHRNPVWTNLDLMSNYRLPLGRRGDAVFEVRVLNVFNNQTRLTTDSQQYLDLRMMSTAPYFAQYLVPNPFFATGSAFAPPRRLQVSLSVNFR